MRIITKDGSILTGQDAVNYTYMIKSYKEVDNKVTRLSRSQRKKLAKKISKRK